MLIDNKVSKFILFHKTKFDYTVPILVCGATAAVQHAVKRKAITKKDVWIQGLV
jgi:hypothetical protein